MQIEHGSFTPLVMSATGVMSRERRKCYVHLLETMSEKRDVSYSTIATWIRKKITFSLVKSAGLCTYGSKSTFSREINKQGRTYKLTYI